MKSDSATAFDVIIVGAGYVGCAAALALDDAGVRTCLVSPRPLAARPAPDWDVRVFTLSPGSEQLLTRLGAWALLDGERLAPVYRMLIEGDAGAGHLDFDAMEAGVSHLATVVEGGRLQAALESAVAKRDGIVVRAPVDIADIQWRRDGVELMTPDGRKFTAGLLIGADGAESMVRMRAGIGLGYRAYGQSGVVANFRCAIAHQGRAFQWFRDDGVLAFLPLPDRLMSIVWSTDAVRAERFVTMDGTDFAREVSVASGGVLGELELISTVAAFPLRLGVAQHHTAHRTVLLGDAAHTVHPLAGQGVNLGFRDVASLSALLKERQPGADVAARTLLNQYENDRRRDTMSMVAVTDGLQRLFGIKHPVARALRSSGMSLMDRLPMVKHALMRQAMH